MAKIQEAWGKQVEAEQTLIRMSSLPDPSYRTLHALFLLQHGQSTEAIAELKRCLEADPDNAEVRSRLIGAYLAMAYFAAAKQRDPRLHEAALADQLATSIR